MAFTYFQIFHPPKYTAQTVLEELVPQASPEDAVQQEGFKRDFAQKIVNYFASLSCGSQDAQVRLLTFDGDVNQPSAAQLDFTNASINIGDTVVIAGITLTCVNTTPNENEFGKGPDSATTATAFANAINSSDSWGKFVVATVVGNSVIAYCSVNGPIGQLVAVVSNSAGIVSASGPHFIFTGGYEATSLPKVYSFGISNG